MSYMYIILGHMYVCLSVLVFRLSDQPIVLLIFEIWSGLGGQFSNSFQLSSDPAPRYDIVFSPAQQFGVDDNYNVVLQEPPLDYESRKEYNYIVSMFVCACATIL